MKHIVLLFLLSLSMAALAQGHKVTKMPPTSPTKNGTNGSTATQVDNLNQRIDILLKDINSMYNVYDEMDDKWFKEKKDKQKKMEEVKTQQGDQRTRNEKAVDSIKEINAQMEWIRNLRDYYEKGSLDDLYRGDNLHPHADTLTLGLHKQLLGENYPKKIDDLMLLAECASLLEKEYNEGRNQEYRNRLAKMDDCKTKRDLDDLLDIHGDIKEDVDKWEDYSLKGYTEFKEYMRTEYGRELDVNFPFLAEQARKKVELK